MKIGLFILFTHIILISVNKGASLALFALCCRAKQKKILQKMMEKRIKNAGSAFDFQCNTKCG